MARLSRLSLAEGEDELLRQELTSILAYMRDLDAVDVTGVEPTFHTVPQVSLRPDEVVPSLPRETALSQAPKVVAEGFAVPKVVDK